MIFPLAAGRDYLGRVPVLRNSAIFDPEKIVEASPSPAKRSFAHRENKVALAQDRVDAIVLYDQPSFRLRFQGCSEARKAISGQRAVLDIPVTVEVAVKIRYDSFDVHVLYKLSDESLVFLCPSHVAGLYRTIYHGVSAGIGSGFLLKVIPMLYDPFILEPEDVESDLWAEEIVVTVSENILAILERADGIHMSRALRKRLEELAQTRETILYSKIMLDVL